MKNKKITILYVLKILRDGSDKEHPISQALITRTINLMGIQCDRKTISRDIDCLIQYGYDIKKFKGGGCYLQNDALSTKDMDNIIYGITKTNLPAEEQINLIKKIKSLSK